MAKNPLLGISSDLDRSSRSNDDESVSSNGHFQEAGEVPIQSVLPSVQGKPFSLDRKLQNDHQNLTFLKPTLSSNTKSPLYPPKLYTDRGSLLGFRSGPRTGG